MSLPAVTYSATVVKDDYLNSPQQGDIKLTRYVGNNDVTENVLLRPVAGGSIRFNAVTGALEVTTSPQHTQTTYTANGALAITSGTHVISKTGSLAAMTLAAPTTAQGGIRLTIVSTTAFAHTVTFTGGTLNDGVTGGGKTTVTFKAFPGSSIVVEAIGTAWYLVGNHNVTSIA